MAKKPVVIRDSAINEQGVQDDVVEASVDVQENLQELPPKEEPFSWQADAPAPVEKRKIWRKVLITLAVIAALFAGYRFVSGKVAEIQFLKNLSMKLENQLQKTEYDDALRKKLSLLKKQKASAVDTIPLVPKSENPHHIKKVLEAKNQYFRVQRNDGQIEVRTGGSVAWRIYNPGRILYGDFAKETGSIGEYSKYAIYPSYDIGRKSLETYLFNTNIYQDTTIATAMAKFAPTKEAEKYTKKISKDLNVSRNTLLKHLSDNKKNEMIISIEELEGNSLTGESRLYKNEKDWTERGF